MKIAVSIPDDVLEQAERLARRTGTSRSRLFSDALKEYVARRAPEDVTAAMDRSLETFVASAAHRMLAKSDW